MIFRYYIVLIFKGTIIKNKVTSIAIGGFDGMHLAHQQLFKKLDTNGAIVVICTGYANLSPNVNRADHTNFPLYYYPLENIKHLSGKEFIKLLYEEFPNLQKIIVGYDFHFGKNAACSVEDLKEIFSGVVEVVEEYQIDDIAVHSKIIRTLLKDDKLADANKLLGYNYTIKGIHIKGQGIGTKQFVSTINIDVNDFLIPYTGIYITRTRLLESSYNSVSFIGHRVTTDGKFAVETHILDEKFDQQIPTTVAIEFLKKIRDNKKFEKYEKLKQQILKDIQQTKQWFERRELIQ